MFTKETVFILGAGASWHYGYPTGEELVKKAIAKAAIACKYFDFSVKNNNQLLPDIVRGANQVASPEEIKALWNAALNYCSELKAGLEQVNPLVIDYFLGWNLTFQTMGRFLIAWVILECEFMHQKNGGNINRKELLENSPHEAERMKVRGLDLKKYKDNWCRFIIHQLAINSHASDDIFKSKVNFITFNYDLSLERALYAGLRHIKRFYPEDIRKFLSEDRVLHIYGKLGEDFAAEPHPLNWSEQSRELQGIDRGTLAQSLRDKKELYDHVYAASKGIYVIDPDDKMTNRDKMEKAVKLIERAEHVYILGYGFDENNSARLRLSELLYYEKAKDKSVFFTNYQDINRVTKRASKIFANRPNLFAPDVLVQQTGNNNHYERSFQDVYEALELDFEQFV